jgi:hypothetical protein
LAKRLANRELVASGDMGEELKTTSDQIHEIDKLVFDALDSLDQVRCALQALLERLERLKAEQALGKDRGD